VEWCADALNEFNKGGRHRRRRRTS
jgi:hypothetical protein